MKKLVSIILVCIMVVALLPASIFAAENVTTISSAEEFAAIANNLGGSYKLTKDITITEAISYQQEGNLFTGTLDGDGHTITVDLKDTNSARFAIFCSAGSCTIKNLTVKGTIESNGNSTGALLGTVKDNATVTIENVTTNVAITSGGGNGTGGMIGCVENGGATITIKNSTNKGAITGQEVAGGFIGKVQDNATVTFDGCVNEGKVENTNQFADYRGAGGFIGVAQNRDSHITFKNSENKGAVTALYVAASASIGHNNVNTENLDYSGLKNSGTITSGGYKLPASMATAKAVGIWGSARFNYDFETGALTGTPEFHETPAIDGFTAYVCGTKATEKVSLEDLGNRKISVSVDTKGIKSVDGFASVTIVFKDGTYATFGCPAPTAADADTVNSSANKLSKHEQIELTYDKAENGFKADGWENDHGSEGNLFGGYKDSVTDTNGKYEGWKKIDQSVKIYFTTAEEVRVGYYALGTGGDDASFPERQFTEWKLWASADGETYVELDHQVDYDMPNINNRLVAFSVDSETAYKFYMVELIKCVSEEGRSGEDGWCYVQLGEIALFEVCDHEWSEPVVVDATCTKDGSSTRTCAKCGEEDVTVIKATGHNFEDGVCTVCGTKEGATPAPTTGDVTVAMVVVALLAIIGTGVVVGKRRSVR